MSSLIVKLFGRIKRYSYHAFLALEIRSRKKRYQVKGEKIRFSILSSVYHKTSSDFLSQMAASVKNQTYSNWELILLANGPVGPDVDKVLKKLSESEKIKVHRVSDNLGIVGAMRYCLQKASGQYVIPVDSDDLVTSDALDILASTIETTGAPPYLYSDEDHLVEGQPRFPFRRPHWDPVLALSSSIVWHLTAFSREIGIDLGVFQDDRGNWCHDWDTLLRFVRAGHTPVHVPEVLYHWRTHAHSSTNQDMPASGSIESQRFVLEDFLKSKHLETSFEVIPFPVHRGAFEWHLQKRFLEDDEVQILPLQENVDLDFVLSTATDVVGFLKDGAEFLFHQSALEACGLFEIHPGVGVVGGRLVTPSGKIIDSGSLFFGGDRPFHPHKNFDYRNPGAFGMVLKPHLVSISCASVFFVRRSVLEKLKELRRIQPQNLPASFYLQVACAAESMGMKTAQSPLISATHPHGKVGEISREDLAQIRTSFPGLLEDRGWSRFYSFI